MKYIFDLKGTKYNRYVQPLKMEMKTLKDKNFIKLNQRHRV